MDPVDRIKTVISENEIVLFMKGTPQFPQCGFSMRTAEALKACNIHYEHVDVYAEPGVERKSSKVF